MSVKRQTTQKQRKEKKMPGDTRFVITPQVKRQIMDIIDERIGQVHVTKEDFSELKSIVRDLAEAQQRTEKRLEELTEAQKRTEEAQQRTEKRVEELAKAQQRTEKRLEELAEAQKRTEEAQQRTEKRLEELAEAQKRTEEAQQRTEKRVEELSVSMKELAEAQKRAEEQISKLANGLRETRVQLGGLSRSFSYSFENEAYRNLPQVLRQKYGYEIVERMVRADIGGKEINFFGKAFKDGKEFYIVGESKIRLDEGDWRSDIFEDLDNKINAVRSIYGDVPIVPILVTHFATKGFLDEATQKGIIVVQSYEW
jgi:DNA repair ATPase RecN